MCKTAFHVCHGPPGDQLACALQDYGGHVQKSVFEAEVVPSDVYIVSGRGFLDGRLRRRGTVANAAQALKPNIGLELVFVFDEVETPDMPFRH